LAGHYKQAFGGVLWNIFQPSVLFRGQPAPMQGTSRHFCDSCVSECIKKGQKSCVGYLSHSGVTRTVQNLIQSAFIEERKTMSTPTTTPEVKNAPLTLTAAAIAKVKEIMAQQTPVPTGLRVGVVGGGCSGFSYSMQFENGAGAMDKTFEFEGLKLYVDATSLMYLQGCSVDYIETLEGAGFKFENPNVKSTCGCGSSFSV
jgi:iron-sulfur cluster assembly accessory protein